jgi:hypothetical protein
MRRKIHYLTPRRFPLLSEDSSPLPLPEDFPLTSKKILSFASGKLIPQFLELSYYFLRFRKNPSQLQEDSFLSRILSSAFWKILTSASGRFFPQLPEDSFLSFRKILSSASGRFFPQLPEDSFLCF